MKLIDADEAFRVLSDYYHHRTETQAAALREALGLVPEAVVRCKDCRYWKDQAEGVVEVPVCEYDCRNGKIGIAQIMGAEDYCSHGERREDGVDR